MSTEMGHLMSALYENNTKNVSLSIREIMKKEIKFDRQIQSSNFRIQSSNYRISD